MITKERNLFTITSDKMTSPVVFDVNTASISRNGKVCTTTPAYSKQAVADYVRTNDDAPFVTVMLYLLTDQYRVPMFRLGGYAENFQLADKFDAIGYNLRDDEYISNNLIRGNIEEISHNFKAFAKYYHSHPGMTYEMWKEAIRVEKLKETYKFPAEYHVLPALESFIAEYGSRYAEQYRPIIAYWMAHGVFNFYYDGNPTGRFSTSRWQYDMSQAFERMISMCEELHIMPEKEDFFRQFGTIQQNFRAYKENANAEQMKDYQQNAPLAFENDKLVVVVPTTPAEFATEAQYQQNCVYSYYMSHVVEHSTHVVFIRHKDSINTPYITCEVSNSGRIRQYLTRYNRSVTDEVGREFYEAYRAYLNRQTWEK